MGLDIRNLGGSLSYRRLAIILDNSPADSAFFQSRYGEEAAWSQTDHLLALIADHLAVANWQRCDPKAKVPFPTPIPRPGVKADRGTHIGTAMPLDELRAFLDRPRKEV